MRERDNFALKTVESATFIYHCLNRTGNRMLAYFLEMGASDVTARATDAIKVGGGSKVSDLDVGSRALDSTSGAVFDS